MANRVIATNKKAAFRYDIIEKVEAGIELRGSEVKSLRQNKVDLKDSYARIDKGEIYLHGLYISPYDKASYENSDPLRVRKLLLHKKQIDKLIGRINQRGFTLVATSLYFNEKGKAKAELALAKGRRLYDQRQKIKKKEMDRQLKKIKSVKSS